MKEKKKTIVEHAHNGQSTTNLYLVNIRKVGPQSRDLKDVVWWRGEKASFRFPARASFKEMVCWDDILPKRDSRQLGPLDAC